MLSGKQHGKVIRSYSRQGDQERAIQKADVCIETGTIGRSWPWKHRGRACQAQGPARVKAQRWNELEQRQTCVAGV